MYSWLLQKPADCLLSVLATYILIQLRKQLKVVNIFLQLQKERNEEIIAIILTFSEILATSRFIQSVAFLQNNLSNIVN